MAASDDRSEKPTQRRIEKAREEGKVLSSRQFLVALQVVIVYALVFRDFGDSARKLLEAWAMSFREVFVEQASQAAILQIAYGAEERLLPWLASIAGLLVFVTLVAQLATSQGSFRFQNLAPQPSKLFSVNKFIDGYKSAHKKLPLFVLASAFFVAASLLPSYWDHESLFGLRGLPLGAQLTYYGEALLKGVRYALAFFVVTGLVDFGLKFKKLNDELMMTKQEVKEESKDTNGNPLIKAALRRRMKALLSNRMMQQVPEATVLIVNPTHFAVALQYDPDTSDAPMVTAKGLDYLALRMRRKAEECGVPVVENPPLAQALYKSAEPGQKIPVELYRAVAEVLAYVFRVLGRKAPSVA
jgi:flagellar biosynthetic protein FlhB